MTADRTRETGREREGGETDRQTDRQTETQRERQSWRIAKQEYNKRL